MQSLLIRIDPGPLTNPAADLCHAIPDRLIAASAKTIRNAGYDYEPETEAMHIYLSAEDAQAALPFVIQLLESGTLEEPGLLHAVLVGVSERTISDSSAYRVAYPFGRSEAIPNLR